MLDSGPGYTTEKLAPNSTQPPLINLRESPQVEHHRISSIDSNTANLPEELKQYRQNFGTTKKTLPVDMLVKFLFI